MCGKNLGLVGVSRPKSSERLLLRNGAKPYPCMAAAVCRQSAIETATGCGTFSSCAKWRWKGRLQCPCGFLEIGDPRKPWVSILKWSGLGEETSEAQLSSAEPKDWANLVEAVRKVERVELICIVSTHCYSLVMKHGNGTSSICRWFYHKDPYL